MATYPIPEYLQDSHDGDEWAVAAILEGRVVALVYLADIAPELCGHVDAPSAEFMIKQWARKAPDDLQQLQQLGAVTAGVVTSDGFRERWPLAAWAQDPARSNDQGKAAPKSLPPSRSTSAAESA